MIGVAAVLALPAQAAAPTIGTLQKQVAKLTAQVAALQKRVTVAEQQTAVSATTVDKLQNNMSGGLQHQQDITVCDYAISTDNLNSVWHVVGLLGQATVNAPAQPDLPRYDDGGACQRLGVTRSR